MDSELGDSFAISLRPLVRAYLSHILTRGLYKSLMYLHIIKIRVVPLFLLMK